VGNSAPNGGGLYIENLVVVDHTIIAFSDLGEAVYGFVVPALSCSDLYGNAGGDWTEDIEHLEGQMGNFCSDPMFCDLASGNYALEHDSPCCPGANPCGLVGAGPIGCTTADAPGNDVASGGRSLVCAPNPFMEAASIRWSVPGPVVLTLHDPAGRRIRTLFEDRGGAGIRAVIWDGRDDHGHRVAAGVYLCRLTSPTVVLTQRLLLLR
jgi:hypothetical protein